MAYKSNIEEFYDKVKDSYDIDYQEFKLICNTPFNFIKKITNGNILRDFRLKYFGVFKVSASKVRYYKKNLQESYSKGNISESYYRTKLKTLEDYEQSNSE